MRKTQFFAETSALFCQLFTGTAGFLLPEFADWPFDHSHVQQGQTLLYLEFLPAGGQRKLRLSAGKARKQPGILPQRAREVQDRKCRPKIKYRKFSPLFSSSPSLAPRTTTATRAGPTTTTISRFFFRNSAHQIVQSQVQNQGEPL